MLRSWNVFARSFAVLLVFAVWSVSAPEVSAVVLHPGQDSTWGLAKPHRDVVGTLGWGGASVVAVGSNYALTARHIGAQAGSRVYFGGRSYKVKQTWTYGNTDLELLKLGDSRGWGNANLRHYTPLYTKRDEVRKQIVLGGAGKGRGATRYRHGRAHAYAWGSNGIRFGANKVDYATTVRAGGYSSSALAIDFDAKDSWGSVRYEAANASGDSGSGWFVRDGGTWKLVGIANAVEHGGASWFRDPDRNYAVRVSSYANWLNGKMGVRSWSSNSTSTSSSSSSGGSWVWTSYNRANAIPEPTSAAAALGLGGVLALVRRRRAA